MKYLIIRDVLEVIRGEKMIFIVYHQLHRFLKFFSYLSTFYCSFYRQFLYDFSLIYILLCFKVTVNNWLHFLFV